jgi:hypothetical protein
MREAIGPRLIEVLTMAWVRPFKTKSDFARAHADIVAMAASDGFLTTRRATGLYDQSWRVTPSGLAHLYTLNGMEGPRD